LALTLLTGARELLAAHEADLPQRDDLCGAFCGALALRAAGIERYREEPVDQDEVALLAGSVVSGVREPGVLPAGERGRRDYRLSLPTIEDSDVSGTTAGGLVSAIEQIGGGALAAVPLSGPWAGGALGGLFDVAAALERPVTLIANLATHHLWGGRPTAAELLEYLLDGRDCGPLPDWRVGHFSCVIGRVSGPGGSLYAVADTYPSLGRRGIHMQPQERLAAAIERREMPAGGVIAVLATEDAPSLRTEAAGLGLVEGAWDNGTVTRGAAPK